LEPKQRIFLTGATGLLGGEITARLLARGHVVTALINRSKEVRNNEGVVLPASRWSGRSPPPGTLTLVPGDVRQDRLGLDDRTWSKVAAGHDLVLHCAAITQFDADEASYRAVDVEGVARVLALGEAGGMKVLHVSTAYVCGMRAGIVLESDLDCGQTFANGYEASKAAAERLVRRSRVPAAMAGPSIVVGNSETGAIRSFDALYAAFRLVAEGRIRRMPATSDATLDFVPMDHVAGGIVALAENMRVVVGKTFHLVSGAPLPVAQFRDAIAAYPQFTAPKLVDPTDFDVNALSPLERRLHTRIATLYASYFQRNPHFDDREFRAAIRSACPPTGPAFLRRLIGHCITVGFLNAEPVSPTITH